MIAVARGVTNRFTRTRVRGWPRQKCRERYKASDWIL
jgi:hypothetical protein